MCRELGHHLSDAELAMAVRSLDKNGDGTIQYEEFIGWWRQGETRWSQLELSPEEMAKLSQAIVYFNFFDADSSGAISVAEFSSLHAGNNASGSCEPRTRTPEKPHRPTERADLTKNAFTTKSLEESLADLDASGDGQVSFNEYVDWLERVGALKVKVMV